MAMTVRPADESDILALILLVGETRGPMPTPDQVEATADVYRALLEDHDQVVRVADADDHVIGVLIAELRPRANWLTPELWISDLLVARDTRYTSAPRVLLQQALAVAEGWQCFRVVMEAMDKDQAGNMAAEAVGFARAGALFSLNLLPGSQEGNTREAATMRVESADAQELAAAEGIPIRYRELGV